jgi:MSHA biogenesis protein MshO
MARSTVNNGFTLIEMVITIVVVGILAGILAPMISQLTNAYVDTNARSELTARGRLALDRLAKEVRRVVPNTIQELNGGSGVEFVTSKIGGRYMSRNDPFAPASYPNANRFQKQANLSSLYILGTDYTDFSATDVLVIYNESPSTLASRSVALNSVTSQDLDGDTKKEVQLLAFSAAHKWGVESTTQHYQIADFCHDIGLTGNALYWKRTTGVGCIDNTAGWINTDPILVSADTLTADFDYIPTSLTNNAILKVTLTLTEQGETVTVSQEMHVRNTP